MDERMKKYITGYTVLLLVPVILLLTGCGNDADVDSVETTESAETMEKVESDGNSIKDHEVDITQDKGEDGKKEEEITPEEVY